MAPPSDQDNSTVRPPAEAELFVVWPLRDEPLLSFALLLALSAASWGVVHRVGPAAGGGVMAALLVCTWRMWLPSATRIGHGGVSTQTLVRRWRLLTWPEIRSCRRFRRGLLLLSTEPTPLAATRGMFIRYGRRRQQLLRAISQHCPALLSEARPSASPQSGSPQSTDPARQSDESESREAVS